MEGAIHTVTEAERNAFTNFMNFYLRGDKDLGHVMPISSSKICSCLEDGTVFCKLVNLAQPGTIINEAINLPEGKEMTVFKKRENLNLAIASGRSIGIVTTNITVESLIDKREHIMLGLAWQTIETFLFRDIDVRRTPEIMVLKEESEEEDKMLRLSPRHILLRWLNWHLKENRLEKRVKNFSKDLTDIEPYLAVFNDISKIDEKAYSFAADRRAAHVMECAQKEGINTFVTVQDLVLGVEKLNLLFCAQIFNSKNGLKYEGKKMPVPFDDDSDSREMRIYKNWINSMGLENGHVVNLVEDLKTGIVLLKLVDNLRPKTVDWDKVATAKLDNQIFCNQNCKYAVEVISRTFDIKVVGISGPEIVDGKHFAILGLLWQLYRVNCLGMVNNMKEEELIQWANATSHQALKSLKDKALEDSQYWLKLIAAINNKIVNFALVKAKGEEGWLEYNAKYALASARKMGAQVIVLWEHISEVNPKFLLVFMADLYRVGNKK
jgi:plastin-1